MKKIRTVLYVVAASLCIATGATGAQAADQVLSGKFPDPTMQPYHITVDSKHNVWGNLWTSDRVVKYNPGANTWTAFDLPVRGTEIRHIASLERDGKTQVVMPVYRTSQMGIMVVRSEAEINALRAQAK